jgi:hypothetical protein
MQFDSPIPLSTEEKFSTTGRVKLAELGLDFAASRVFGMMGGIAL